MTKIKPNREECRIIRKAAEDACRKEGQRLVRVEAGKRCALTLDVDPSINIFIVDPTPDWEDSDLLTSCLGRTSSAVSRRTVTAAAWLTSTATTARDFAPTFRPVLRAGGLFGLEFTATALGRHHALG